MTQPGSQTESHTEVLVNSADVLETALVKMQSCPEIALDLESDSYFRYRPSVCTAQFAWFGEAGLQTLLLDTLDLTPADHLPDLLSATGPTKVIHDAGFDARILYDQGIALDNVYDTAVAARFLGEPATGLGALLGKFLGVEIKKQHQLADWAKRPLPPEQLSYLVEDVSHLLQLKARLAELVDEAGIADEVAVETQFVVTVSARVNKAPKPEWSRVRGYTELEPAALAVLRELALERNRWAEKLNVPAFRVVGNSTLLGMSKSPPKGIEPLLQRWRVKDRSLAQALLDAAVRGDGTEVPASEWDALRGSRESPEVEKARKVSKKRLLAFRKAAAATREVNEQVILPGHCVADLVRLAPRTPAELGHVPGLGACRVERYGETILDIFRKA